MKQWGDMSHVFIGNGRAGLPESLDDFGNLERVPYQDGVGYQAQAARAPAPPRRPKTLTYRFRATVSIFGGLVGYTSSALPDITAL
jgi:hypothetical protein